MNSNFSLPLTHLSTRTSRLWMNGQADFTAKRTALKMKAGIGVRRRRVKARMILKIARQTLDIALSAGGFDVDPGRGGMMAKKKPDLEAMARKAKIRVVDTRYLFSVPSLDAATPYVTPYFEDRIEIIYPGESFTRADVRIRAGQKLFLVNEDGLLEGPFEAERVAGWALHGVHRGMEAILERHFTETQTKALRGSGKRIPC